MSRRARRTRQTWQTTFLLLFLLWNILDVLHVSHNLPSKQDVTILARPHQRVYITSIHWNCAQALVNYWSAALLSLVTELGPDNVYVSLVESGSFDDTKTHLRRLDQELASLGVQRRIVLDDSSHAQEINDGPGPDDSGWTNDPTGKLNLRRIPYLSRWRNKALEPLQGLAKQGQMFDKVLFLNDVVFQTKDVLELLKTRGGDYAAACALDFSRPPTFYDTFALRDSEGHEAATSSWPYFRSRDSRHAIKDNRPVPVRSCWNGLVAIDSAPFYDNHPLTFRGVSDTLAAAHVEGSECCLIHVDNRQTHDKGVWVNPNVRVGYSNAAYSAMNPPNGKAWMSAPSILVKLWTNRVVRWTTTPKHKERMMRKRIRQWQDGSRDRVEMGDFCLINEMQVIVDNGWAHV